MRSVDEQYPHVASWVQDGWVEIGYTDYGESFVRVLDIGGEIWSCSGSERSLDEALSLADSAIADWCKVNMSDLIVGTFNGISFSMKQGQYLAFIYNYTQIHGQAPAEADIRRYFGVTPPTVHQMILRLEELGFISRIPRQARSIRVLVPPQMLPVLKGNDG